MLTRLALFALPLALPFAAIAAAPSPAPADPGTVKVALDTDKGRIVLALDAAHAPKTTANFLKYVDGHKLDGEGFYRAMPYGDGGGLVQGGITSDARKLLPPVAHEPSSETGIKNVAGSIAMARLEPGSARSDFFIETVDIPGFDASATDPGFAAFGHVVEGMDVVKAIFSSPRSPTKGVGVMKGQMLDPPVRILKASRLP
ncbi:peptidylprolyl isomerase [Sphingomonas sp. ASV193]|uniref:peptidylprolyl isomerase n=1 Tax=Sphingomonas sp. ASV193 TaxID=3144405 RepID=UPI0032E8CC7B